MRAGLLLVLLIGGLAAADYHVAAGGSDAADGSQTTPFATVAQALSVAGSGDRVLLKRGDVFREGGLSVPGGVTLTDYGSGAVPALHGSAAVSGWSAWSQNAAVQTATVATGGAAVVDVFVAGERLTLARYPDSGWLRVDSGTGNDTIVDSALASHPQATAGRWAGAQVRWRKWSWWHENRPITADDGAGTLTLGGSTFGNNTGIDSGYFITNDLDELDAPGEWYWDGTTLYVYPPTGVDLGAVTVEAAFRSRGVSLGGGTLQDVAFRHYVDEAVRVSAASVIERCIFDDLAVNGVEGVWNAFGSRIAHCQFSDILNNALVWNENPGGSGGTVFEDNTFTAIGTVPGFDQQGSWTGVAVLISNGKAVVVRRNHVDGTGYAGILFGSDGQIAERNVLVDCMATENDGAAIYCNAGSNVIRENIILNVEGDLESSHPWTPLGHGIWVEFLSEFANSTIEHNTVYGSGGSGLYLDNNFDCTITGNRFVSNQNGGMRLAARDGASSTNHNHSFVDNVLAIGAVPFATTEPRNLASWADTTDRCLSFEPTDGDSRDIDYGSMAGTDFLTASGDDYVRVSRWVSTLSIAEWQSQEANWADPSPRVNTGAGYLFINDTVNATTMDLPGGITWQHLDGSSAGTSVSLQPYRSVVLIATGGDTTGLAGYTLKTDETIATTRSITIETSVGVDGFEITSDDPGASLPGPAATDPATFGNLDARDGHILTPVDTSNG